AAALLSSSTLFRSLVGRVRIGVEQAPLAYAKNVVEGDGLELALRPVAHQRHDAAVGSRQPLRCEGRHGCCAQRGRKSELGYQTRVAGVDLGEYAESRHSEQALRR